MCPSSSTASVASASNCVLVSTSDAIGRLWAASAAAAVTLFVVVLLGDISMAAIMLFILFMMLACVHLVPARAGDRAPEMSPLDEDYLNVSSGSDTDDDDDDTAPPPPPVKHYTRSRCRGRGGRFTGMSRRPVPPSHITPIVE